MIALDEEALICDLAETYGIYEYHDFPPTKIAIFANGLSPESRIKMKQSGDKVTLSQLIAAISADKLANLVWMNSEDGQERKNPPQYIVPLLLGKEQTKNKNKNNVVVYDSPEEFHAAMKRKYGG